MTSSRWRGPSHRWRTSAACCRCCCGTPPTACVIARGTRLLMGNALPARLFYSLRQRKVPVWLNASLRELTTADGRVTGAVLSVDGEMRRVTARRAVVLATGGFGGSVERLNEYVRPPLQHAVAFAGARARAWRSHARPAPASRTITRSRRSGRRCRRPHGSPAGAAPIRISRSTAPSPALIAVNSAGPALRRRSGFVS